MKKFVLVSRYAAFAVTAILANLGAQRLVLWFGESAVIFIFAIIVGTLVGLVVKFTLDKRFIFFDTSKGLKAQGELLSRYSITGIVTTLIFWGSETAFWAIWRTEFMRELGAILGLGIGYIMKFNLDQRYVFVNIKGRRSS
jgi:putative flippase GtrA